MAVLKFSKCTSLAFFLILYNVRSQLNTPPLGMRSLLRNDVNQHVELLLRLLSYQLPSIGYPLLPPEWNQEHRNWSAL